MKTDQGLQGPQFDISPSAVCEVIGNERQYNQSACARLFEKGSRTCTCVGIDIVTAIEEERRTSA
jgi:hypothetical protein